jgi:hypothetical protein
MPYAITRLILSARLWSIAAVLLALGSAPSAAAPPKRVEARFEVFGFAGIHLLTNRTTVEEAAHQYGITMDLDTRGLARVFVDLTSHSDVRGDLDGNSVHPQLYRSDVSRNGVGRHYRVDYGGDGTVVDASIHPSSTPPLPVTKEQIRSTVDQLTAYFLLERQLSEGGTCTMVVRVFDGSGLYNLHFTNYKQETLSADGYQNFTGPTQSCEVVRQDLVTNPDGSERTYQRGKIWYAHVVPGAEVMPVRMEYDTAFGVVRGYLAEVHGAGIDLHLMRD